MENLFPQIWSEFSSEIVSGSITIVIAFATFFLRPRVSLIWGQANKSWHSIPVEEGNVHVISEKNFVQNMGRAPATNVEVVYDNEPTKLLVFPQRDYKTSKNPDGAHIVTIPFIAPKELVTLDGIFINIKVGQILSVKCKEREGKIVPFFVVRKMPNWFYRIIVILLFAGITFFIGTLIKVFN